MSGEFITFSAITLTAWLITLAMVRLRNATDLSRCVGWYMLIFLATYLVRPAASEIIGDMELYQLLRLGNFEDHWWLMAIAVPLAIISFGIGYALTGRGSASYRAPAQPLRVIDQEKVKVLAFALIVLGYVATILIIETGVTADVGNYAGAATGVYEHNTAWFAQADLFVSVGALLYYLVTGRLTTSLVIAGPWMGFRVVSGWGRTNLLGHLYSLLAIYFLKRHFEHKTEQRTRHLVFLGSAVLLVLILFPFLGEFRTVKQEFHLSSSGMSKDALSMVSAGADPQDLMQSYLGTASSVAGFETTLSHLLYDRKSEMGVSYLYYYLINPIPRMLWHGKGNAYSWAEDLRGVEFDPLLGVIGAAPGSIGMSYQEWGWLGIPLEFIFTGWLIKKAEEAVRRRPDALHLQLGYAGLYSMIPQLGRDSIIYMIAAFWLFKYGIVTFILWRMYQSAPYKRAQKAGVRPRALGFGMAPGGAGGATL
jgi:hypothetical protein